MVLKRKIYDELLRWKKGNGKSALLVEGASRVGKTEIVSEFARNEYETCIRIDFSETSPETESAIKVLKEYLNDLDTLFMLLSTAYATPLVRRKSLIIFDEVEKSPRARECIKHLVADGRYDYIETGSLVSLRENTRDILIPSEEDSVKMYPMDFEEFCRAIDEVRTSDYIRDCFDKQTKMYDGLHRRAMRLFKEYMVVGGMPEAVKAYADGGKNLISADIAKDDILDEYRKDILKLFNNSKVYEIYRSIPACLSSRGERLKYKEIGKGTYSRTYENDLFWLRDSMICNVCTSIGEPGNPLSPEGRKNVKLYMGDTGLLINLAFDRETRLASKNSVCNKILNGDISEYDNMLYKNAVAQALVSLGYHLNFYNHYNRERHTNDMEIDFLVREEDSADVKFRPMEVKSDLRYRAISVNRFKETYPEITSTPVVVHPKNLEYKNGTLYIPPYMTFCL